MNRQFLSAFRRRGLFALFPLLLSAAAAFAQTVTTADSQNFVNDIKALTTDKMEGRGDGTKGLTRAEHLIVHRYKQLGFEPRGSRGYLQAFTLITGRRLRSGNTLAELPPPQSESAEAKSYNLLQDFIPITFSSSGSASAPVVFAGYGITAPEDSYDDYQSLDTKGKIVLVLFGEPHDLAAKASSGGPTQHSSLVSKAINAKNHGAAAILFARGKLREGEEDLLQKFGDTEGPEDAGIVCLQVKNSLADSWLRAQGEPLAEVQSDVGASLQSLAPPAPESKALNLAIQVDIQKIRKKVNNVIAYLPGKTDEYVIVGAHYDHLGRGDFHSMAPSQIGQIHPGADDNASGTAGVLEMARLFAPLKGQLQRGILFMNFAGEELGLLGSAEWVRHPTMPLDKAVAMLNMDMIGRIKDNKIYIGGWGTGSTFGDVLHDVESASKFKFENSPGGYSSSDHTSFVTKQIPVLFFFSGLHSDYHKPSDTWDKINGDAGARLLDVVSTITLKIDGAAERPTYVAVVETPNPHAGMPVTGSSGGYGPYFGSIPDFGQTENGVRFSDVKPGSPAAKVGFKGGDVLIKFGDKVINNLYDFTDALRRSHVGDEVEVTVLRDGQPIKATVKLEQRR